MPKLLSLADADLAVPNPLRSCRRLLIFLAHRWLLHEPPAIPVGFHLHGRSDRQARKLRPVSISLLPYMGLASIWQAFLMRNVLPLLTLIKMRQFLSIVALE